MTTVAEPEPVSKPAPAAKPRKPRPKPARSIRIDVTPCHEGPGSVTITVGGDATAYVVDVIPSDWGLAFRLSKSVWDGGDVYDVLLDPQGGRHSCTCLGWYRHQHCKHVEGFLALHNAGLVR